MELGKITKVYGDDYASTKPSVLEKIAERERLKAMLADTFEAEEAPPPDMSNTLYYDSSIKQPGQARDARKKRTFSFVAEGHYSRKADDMRAKAKKARVA